MPKKTRISRKYWESICIQCGLCCLTKLCGAVGEVFLTNVLCDHLDKQTKKCKCYSADFDHRDAPDGGCAANNGGRLNLRVLKNDYVVPGCCAYVKKFIGETNSALPDIDLKNCVYEKDMPDGDSLKNHVITGSADLFKYNPAVNKRLHEITMKFL